MWLCRMHSPSCCAACACCSLSGTYSPQSRETCTCCRSYKWYVAEKMAKNTYKVTPQPSIAIMHKSVASWENSQNSIRVPRGNFLQVPLASSQPYHAGQSWAKRLAGSLVVSTLHRGCVDETIEPMALVYHQSHILAKVFFFPCTIPFSVGLI